MAKTQKLSSQWDVKQGVLSFGIEARALDATKDAAPLAKFSRFLALATLFGEGYTTLNDAGQAALEFGAFTALRNSTGSCEDITEAEAAVDRRLEAFAAGEWGAEREGTATPFSATHSLAIAVERASKGAQTAAQAAEKLSALVEAACAANSLPAFASMDGPERSKVRKQVLDSILKAKPLVAAQYAAVENEKAQAALARKAEAAAKALAAAEGADETGTTI